MTPRRWVSTKRDQRSAYRVGDSAGAPEWREIKPASFQMPFHWAKLAAVLNVNRIMPHSTAPTWRRRPPRGTFRITRSDEWDKRLSRGVKPAGALHFSKMYGDSSHRREMSAGLALDQHPEHLGSGSEVVVHA